MNRRKTKLFLSILFLLISYSTLALGEAPPDPLNKFSVLKNLRYLRGKVVFVKKGVYGGNFEYSAHLRGKVKNITTTPYKNIYIIWAVYDENKKLYDIYYQKDFIKSLFFDKIDYLDGKSETDFEVVIDLYSGAGHKSAEKMRNALNSDRQKAGIYIKKQ